MVKPFAICTLILAGINLSGAVTFLCKPPASHATSPKKFKLMTCTLLTFSVFLILVSVALLKR
jgi:hypothetical protein